MNAASENLVKLGWLTVAVATICAVAWTVSLAIELTAANYDGEALDVDFAVFWAAAKLSLAEGPLAPFDVDRLNEARAVPGNAHQFPMLWLYPPAWLTVVLPLGTLPFFWAWLIFCAISFAAFALATRGPARAIPGGWALLLAGPAVLVTLALGQNSLIFAALLVVALEAIRRDDVMLAGLTIAAMTLKPQLGLAIPAALLAGRHFRVILWASAGAIVIALASLIWPGADYWPLFFAALSEGSEAIRASELQRMMVSVYGSGMMLGLDKDTALVAQAVLSIAALAGLAWLWAGQAPFDLKAAGLALGILLVTPYAIYYEIIFATIGCLYLLRAGVVDSRSSAFMALVIWLTPVIGIFLLPKPGFFFAAPAVLAAFAFTLYRAWPCSRA